MKMKTRDDAVRFIKRKRKAADHYEQLVRLIEHIDPDLPGLEEHLTHLRAGNPRLEELEVMFGLKRHDA
jgi:hypothetical protein